MSQFLEFHYRFDSQVLLFILNQQFQDDTETLVIAPITKMVTIIKQLAMDPLKKPEHVQTMEEAEDMMREIQGKKKKKRKQKKKGPELETAMLEHTIIRIGDLIQVGFGTSGKDVIGKNMSCGDPKKPQPPARVVQLSAHCTFTVPAAYVRAAAPRLHSPSHCCSCAADAFILRPSTTVERMHPWSACILRGKASAIVCRA